MANLLSLVLYKYRSVIPRKYGVEIDCLEGKQYKLCQSHTSLDFSFPFLRQMKNITLLVLSNLLKMLRICMVFYFFQTSSERHGRTLSNSNLGSDGD